MVCYFRIIRSPENNLGNAVLTPPWSWHFFLQFSSKNNLWPNTNTKDTVLFCKWCLNLTNRMNVNVFKYNFFHSMFAPHNSLNINCLWNCGLKRGIGSWVGAPLGPVCRGAMALCFRSSTPPLQFFKHPLSSIIDPPEALDITPPVRSWWSCLFVAALNT